MLWMFEWRTCRSAGVIVAAACLIAGGIPSTASALPDGRAYELVSPSAKNGADVHADAGKTYAATDGGAVSFVSFSAFGDVVGTGTETAYVSKRTAVPATNGWQTHAITPAQQPLTGIVGGALLFPGYDGDLSPDLSRGIYRAWRPLTNAPNVTEVPNLYLRTGLLEGNGTTQLLTDAFAPIPAPRPNALRSARQSVAGTSADFSHVVFESRLRLIPDAVPGVTNVYEAVNGIVRLVSVLPDGTPAGASTAGLGASLPNALYTPNVISADGSRVFFVRRSDGRAYMRRDGVTTVEINASEKTFSESPQPATLWTANTAGTRVFLTTNEGLVNGDDDGLPDLYMYEPDAPAGERLTRLSVDNEPADTHFVDGVIGVSDDGSYVYFTCSGQLVAGEPATGITDGLYVWHEGTVRYIGTFADHPDARRNSLATLWTFAPEATTARVTPDGRNLAFMASNDDGFAGRGGLISYDHGTCSGFPCREWYVYRYASGSLACATCNPAGTPATVDPWIQFRAVAATNTTYHRSHALSDDGKRVFFSTAEALVTEDTNGKLDAYEYDTSSRRVALISSGKDPYDSIFLDASASGNDVFFTTRERLVGWDRDDLTDLYDARVGGGLPEPARDAPGCEGEGCQGEISSMPAPGSAASRAFRGAGNADQRLRARHRRRARCVHRRGKTRTRTTRRCRRPKPRPRTQRSAK